MQVGPDPELVLEERAGKRYVLDPVRRRFVRLTPEEFVRQQTLRFLIDVVEVPAGLISVEMAFVYNGMTRRADIVVHGRDGSPLLLVECKKPDVAITQAVLDQAGGYNVEVGASYLVVTNGREHFGFRVDRETGSTIPLNQLPHFGQMNSETYSSNQ